MRGLREKRYESGIRQVDLARDLSVSQPMISLIESGKRVLTTKKAEKASRILGCSVHELLMPRK